MFEVLKRDCIMGGVEAGAYKTLQGALIMIDLLRDRRSVTFRSALVLLAS
jgi:hypothetical protein